MQGLCLGIQITGLVANPHQLQWVCKCTPKLAKKRISRDDVKLKPYRLALLLGTGTVDRRLCDDEQWALAGRHPIGSALLVIPCVRPWLVMTVCLLPECFYFCGYHVSCLRETIEEKASPAEQLMQAL